MGEQAGKPLFLVGFMGSGKTTVSRVLAGMLGRRAVEMDALIEQREGKAISAIFAEDSEACFRNLETALLRELCRQGNVVVSCGGGVVLREENRQMMREHGWVVYLWASPETVLERVRGENTRPLLQNRMNLTEIEEMMAGRTPLYRSTAHFTAVVDNNTPDQICREICANLQWLENQPL